MIVYIDGKEHVMCDACFSRWPVGAFEGALTAYKHLCEECIGKRRPIPETPPAEPEVAIPPKAPMTSDAWCGTPKLSRTWAQGQEGV